MDSSQRLGPIDLENGVSRSNALTFLYAAFFSISLVTILNFLQAYIITEHLLIPEAEQGVLSGDLQVWNEVVAILMVIPLGIWSDRIGRRIIFVAGLIVLGVSYIWYPLVSSVPELIAARILHSIGAAGVTGMLGILAADYALESSRGKLVAAGSTLIGLGIAVIVRLLGTTPAMFVDRGYDSIQAGTYACWVVAGICFFTALVLQLGLKPGRPIVVERELPTLELFKRGMAATRDPRIAVAYASGFVSRADQSIAGLFISLWALQAGVAQGMTSSDSLAAATTPFLVAIVAGLCWAPMFGFLLDRVNRMTGISVALGLGFVGYCVIGFVSNPLESSTLPLFALLGLGQISTLIGSQTLIAKVADDESRGSVIGIFGFWGAIGIVLSAFAGGRLFDYVGPTSPFIMMGLLQGLLLIAALIVRKRSS